MGDVGLYVVTAVAAYLLGNIQFAVIISHIRYKDDIRNHGSGNAGSTNMLRVYGAKSGLVTFIGDFVKGILAVLIGRWIAGEVGSYIASVFVVLGHSFPVFLKFKGGKGVASTFGIIWMLNPLYAAIITVIAFLLICFTRIIAVASLGGMTVFFILTLIFNLSNTPLVVCTLILWLIILLRHIENIQRMIRGEEKKVFTKKDTSA